LIDVDMTGSSRQRSGLWNLGTGLACVALLPAWSHSTAGTLAGQPVVSPVWRSTLQGHREDGDKTESGEPLWSGATSSGL